MLNKTRILIVALCAFAFAGCQTTPGSAPVDNTALVTGVIQTAVSVGSYEVMKTNPRYASTATALVAGIDLALSGSAVITDETITTFVYRIGAQNHLDPVESEVFAGLARTALAAYKQRYGTSVPVLISNPNAKAYVMAFSNGLKDGLRLLSTVPKPAV